MLADPLDGIFQVRPGPLKVLPPDFISALLVVYSNVRLNREPPDSLCITMSPPSLPVQKVCNDE